MNSNYLIRHKKYFLKVNDNFKTVIFINIIRYEYYPVNIFTFKQLHLEPCLYQLSLIEVENFIFDYQPKNWFIYSVEDLYNTESLS